MAKVMFLQVCVCPRGGGCLPQCMLGCQPPLNQADPPWDQADPPGPGRPPGIRQTSPQDQADPPGPGRHPPGTRQTPRDQADTPQDQADTPPGPPSGSRLQHTVYERPVRILLECILVFFKMVPKVERPMKGLVSACFNLRASYDKKTWRGIF